MVGDGSWLDDWKGQAGMTSRKLGVAMEGRERRWSMKSKGKGKKKDNFGLEYGKWD